MSEIPVGLPGIKVFEVFFLEKPHLILYLLIFGEILLLVKFFGFQLLINRLVKEALDLVIHLSLGKAELMANIFSQKRSIG